MKFKVQNFVLRKRKNAGACFYFVTLYFSVSITFGRRYENIDTCHAKSFKKKKSKTNIQTITPWSNFEGDRKLIPTKTRARIGL